MRWGNYDYNFASIARYDSLRQADQLHRIIDARGDRVEACFFPTIRLAAETPKE